VIVVGNAAAFFREWQKRVALGAADATARVLTEEEDDEGEDETEADCESERNYGHGAEGLMVGSLATGRHPRRCLRDATVDGAVTLK
jgi:hypothetical protein